MCFCFSVRRWQTTFLQREVSAKLLYCSNSVLLVVWDGDENNYILLLFVCLFLNPVSCQNAEFWWQFRRDVKMVFGFHCKKSSVTHFVSLRGFFTTSVAHYNLGIEKYFPALQQFCYQHKCILKHNHSFIIFS